MRIIIITAGNHGVGVGSDDKTYRKMMMRMKMRMIMMTAGDHGDGVCSDDKSVWLLGHFFVFVFIVIQGAHVD